MKRLFSIDKNVTPPLIILKLYNNRIFLQHGVIKDDLPFVYYKNARFRLFICSAKREFEYVKNILERAKNTIFDYLATLEEYDVSEPVEVTNTIFIIKKYGKEMVLITRPSDYGQVILYYGAEKDTLDFEKDYELWVEDGIEKPQQITFGKMLKLTGINRIPLRKVR